MTRAQETMVRAVTDALRHAGTVVRADGWPAELIVDYVAERDTYAVSLRVEIPPLPTPIEADGDGAK